MSIKSVLPSNHLILRSYDKPRHCIKKQRHYFPYKGLYSQSYGFSHSHVWIWELDNKKGWVPKNWCLRTVVLEKTLESPLDCKEIKPVNPKGNQSWIFTGRTDAEPEADAPINILATWCEGLIHWKRPWCWERLKAGGEGGNRGWTAGWHHWLSEQEFEQTPGDREYSTPGKPHVLQSMGSQRVRHNWVIERRWHQPKKDFFKKLLDVQMNYFISLTWILIQFWFLCKILLC